MPQIGTLQDLRCITASGVTRGSAWRVPELTGTHFRFGSGAGASSAGAAAEAAEQEAAMEALAEALKAQEDAEQRQAAAQQVCACPQACLHAACPIEVAQKPADTTPARHSRPGGQILALRRLHNRFKQYQTSQSEFKGHNSLISPRNQVF